MNKHWIWWGLALIVLILMLGVLVIWEEPASMRWPWR